MKPKLLFPTDIRPDTPVGGKARNLWVLSEAGFSVPEWLVVIDDCDGSKINEAVTKLGGDQFAVRSSALQEDSADHSFAGQFDSFLFVKSADVPEKIRAVRASADSEHVRVYSEEQGIHETLAPPCAIVQKMIDADVAGVAFSADPVSGRRQHSVVSAVRGVGEALVSGEADADTFVVERNGFIGKRDLTGDEPILTDSQIREVAELARRCQDEFGCPQDIEWAIAEGKLYLLQSRPITSLSRLPDPDEPLTIWDNSNIAESYSGVTSPLTFTFARRIYENVYREFCRILSVPGKRIAANDEVFANMLGQVRGRVYYNLINWYRVLACLPGFRINRGFMEQMMGVKEPMPDEVVNRIEREISGRGKLRDWLGLMRTLFGLIRNQISLKSQIRNFYKRLNTALAEPTIPLQRMTASELVEHYRDLESQLLKKWDAPLVNDFFAMIFFGVLGSLCKKWLHDEDGILQNELIAGGEGIISTEPVRRIQELGALARKNPEIVERLRDGKKLDGFGEFSEKLDGYLEKFGDRCLEELKLESPTLNDDPGSLHTAILAVARLSAEDADKNFGEKTQTNVNPAPHDHAAITDLPFPKKQIFHWVLRNARARVRDRENLRFERTRLFGRVRRIFVELGKRLHTDGALPSQRDVFNLNIDEVLGFFSGTVTNLSDIVCARRAEFALYQSEIPPPDRFETRGAPGLYTEFEATQQTSHEKPEGDFVQGIGCCAGVIRGRARVVRSPRGVTLQPGEILVAQQTDPGWVMLFPAAAGVLVERGSLLSHSAIVSREMGIPSVVSIRGLLEWIEDGELLELDGKAGTVRKISEPDDEHKK